MTRQKPASFLQQLTVTGAGMLLVVSILACGLGQRTAGGPTISRLPTLTPTANTNAPDAADSPAEDQSLPDPPQTDSPPRPVGSETPQAEIARLPTLTPTAQNGQQSQAVSATPPSDSAGNVPASETPQWQFSGIKVNPKPNEGIVQLLGDITNISNSAQKLSFITGTFYDAQGNPVAGEDFTVDYWPTNIVPPGSKLPFEVIVLGVQNIADFDLRAEAQVVDNNMVQGFEFADVNLRQDESLFCLDGQLINSTGQVQENLIIIAVMFDDQDRVAGFADFTANANQSNIQPLPFDMCTEVSQPNISRHELRAWGQ